LPACAREPAGEPAKAVESPASNISAASFDRAMPMGQKRPLRHILLVYR